MVPAVLLFAGFAAVAGASYLPCSSLCREKDCDEKPENCLFGEAKVCGRFVCAKGPGERCGGHLNQFGVCGDGMTCNSCGFCKGCTSKAFLKIREPCSYPGSILCF